MTTLKWRGDSEHLFHYTSRERKFFFLSLILDATQWIGFSTLIDSAACGLTILPGPYVSDRVLGIQVRQLPTCPASAGYNGQYFGSIAIPTPELSMVFHSDNGHIFRTDSKRF
jgi:hypothetical protein